MPLHGKLFGKIAVGSGLGAGGNAAPAPDNPPAPPVITSYGAADTTLVEGDEMDTTWTLSGGMPDTQIIDWGDGSANSTITPGTTTASHEYDIAGNYTATLTVSNAGGSQSDSETITGIEVDAAPALAWKTWSPLTSMTETRRNMTGSSVTGAHIDMPIQFSPGEVPTTRTLQLRDPSNSIVPSTDWQWDERSTYPDGSLRFCIVRAYNGSSWADDTTLTWTIETVSGSWPALTSGTTTSLVTGNSDFEIRLADVRRVGPNGSTSTTAWTHSSLTFSFNDALGLAGSTKVIAGPICDAWEAWAYFANGGTDDTDMWCKARVVVYKEPGTGAVVRVKFDPLVMNGWARHRGLAKVYKMSVYDGATLLRDFAETITIGVNDINPAGSGPNASVRFNRGWENIGTRTQRLHAGQVVKIGASPHSPLVAGDFHFINKTGTGGTTLQLTFNELGRFDSGGTDSDRVIFSTANSSTFTIEKYTYHLHTRVFPIRTEYGEPFWGTAGSGGCRILPYYSEAEKLKRMETGQFRNYVLGATSTLPIGFTPNDTKNTSALISWWENHDYQPGVVFLTSPVLDNSGGEFGGANHIGEADSIVRDFVQDMELGTQELQFYVRLRQCSAETASELGHLNKYDNATNGTTSRENATQLCINNGSDDAGTEYPDMGPCFPSAWHQGGTNSTRGYYLQGTDTSSTDEDQFQSYTSGGQDGSHTPRAYMYSYGMFGDWSDLELTRCAYGMVSTYDEHTGGGTDLAGNSKTYDGEKYYRISIVNWAQRGQTRHFIAANHILAWALLSPDYTPERAMYDDIAADNVNLLELAYDDPAIVGSRAKATGGMIHETSGGYPQHWQVARMMATGLYLVKNSGITAPNCVRALTAFSRLLWGDPVQGSPMPQHIPGNVHGLFFSFWDKAKVNPTHTDTDPTAVRVRFLNDASWATDGSTCGMFPGPGSPAAWQLSFLTDGETGRVSIDTNSPNFYPQDGDRFQHSGNHSPGLPTGFSAQTWYWIYDVELSVIGSRANASSSGDIIAVGETITQGGNTATVTFSSWTGTDNFIRHTKPTPNDFVNGAFTASTTGARVFNNAMFQIEGADFKVSTTPGPSYTQITWSTASIIASEDDGIAWLCESEPQGPRTGGRLPYVGGTINDYTANVVSPVTIALHLFGTESGCSTANDNYEAWIDDFLALEGYVYGDIYRMSYSTAAANRYNT